MFPPTVTSKKLFNTCVRPHAGDDSAVTFVMAYEFNEPGAGWQTGFAETHDADLREARWTCVPRPSPESMASASASDSVAKYAELSHANPTLRFGNDGWWYLLSTRGTNKTLVEEVWRSRDVTSFVWEAPASWSRQDATVAAFLVPSHADQTPLRNGWHPDTHSVVEEMPLSSTRQRMTMSATLILHSDSSDWGGGLSCITHGRSRAWSDGNGARDGNCQREHPSLACIWGMIDASGLRSRRNMRKRRYPYAQ